MKNDTADRLAIIELALAYSSAASRKSRADMERVFVPDGRVAGVAKLVGQGDVDVVGAKTIAEFFGGLWDGLEFVHHTSQIVDVQVEGDRARANTMIIEYARPIGGKLMMVLGDYADDMVRTAEGWRFVRRALSVKTFTFLAEAPA